MNTENKLESQTQIWRQFCIDVLSSQQVNLQTLNIDAESSDVFVQFLYKHGLESLLIDHLEQQNNSSLLPDYIVEKLIEIRRASYIKEIYRKKHLEKLLTILNSNHIKCLILKGTAFAYSIYKKPYQRSRQDTDILIRYDDKEKMDQLLLNSGFSKSMNITGELISHQNTYLQNENGIKHAYDIHWKISNRNAYADLFVFDKLYETKNDITELSNNAFCLNNVEAFVHATVHYFGHRSDERDRLIWVYDLHLLATQFSHEDWDLLLISSKEKELDPLCEQVLVVCKDTFATPIPTEIFQALGKSKIQLSEIEHKRINNNQWSRVDQFKSDWAVLSLSQRFQLVKEYLFPPVEFILKQQSSTNKLLLPYFYIKRLIIGGVKIFRNKKSS